MSYESLFTRYGSPSKEAEIRITGYLLHPSKLTADRITWNDESAARIISQCENTIESLKEYRQALAARYAQLAAAPYRLRLELERVPEGWQRPRIWYYVRIRRIYEDGTEVMDLEEKYTGQERRAAFARFEELKKQRPGIELLQSTEKRSWER